MKKDKEHLGFSKGVNDYYNHYITVADAKAGVLIAISFVVFDFLKDLKHCSNLENFLFYCSSILLMLTCAFSVCAVFPRNPKKKKGVVFWENVKEFKNDKEYYDNVTKLDLNKIEKTYSIQNYHLSKLLSRKYFFIRITIIVFIPSLISLSILYFLN
ncbi:Pycsar system effector family protein [Winogradskyella sp. SM1960]|uniref:Pycsar system effector family protein n=1 Tax=Winogradskyella sp. SM1960 TaxID=2865955 RepID=UPI001CD46DE4|nr:Pycsar system effector family protein [Winogradskyella sp. SM1960]